MGYRQVYFRIRSQYEGYRSFPNEQAEINFKEESRRLFQDAGWTLHAEPLHSGVSDTVTNGQQELYLHPMNFSGVVLEEEIPQLEALLSQAKTFHCYAVDRYAEYLDLDDEEYWALLESRREEIETAVMDQYRTKRKNLFITGVTGLDIAEKFSVKRVCDKNGRKNKAYLFVRGLIEQLIKEGRLVTADTKRGLGIRTATKEELKRLAG